MNSHLNIFKGYAKDEREFQLENDLTRAFAISIQEDNLFFHEILKHLLTGSNYYNQLFEDFDGDSEISIEIQKKVSSIGDFDHVFAVSLSENVMEREDFWSQNHKHEYDPICDIFIRINNIIIVFEAKRNNVNCTTQLFNQIHNLYNLNQISEADFNKSVSPVDLNWPLLMEMAVKIYSFEKATENKNRFLSDFIHLIRSHNYRWLPEAPIGSLSSDNIVSIKRRLESAVQELCKSENYTLLNNRIGIQFQKPWAQEVLFSINGKGGLVASIFPGNTKSQGNYIFSNDLVFNTQIKVIEDLYELEIIHHIKFTSFQRYFSGLFFVEKDLNENLYTKDNFWNFSGRKKRGKKWDDIENLFDRVFKSEFKWKEYCNWNEKIASSGKNQFDISFGYEISINIPFERLKKIDQKKSDLSGLIKIVKDIYLAFNNQLLK
jgi:hypothetical protein